MLDMLDGGRCVVFLFTGRSPSTARKLPRWRDVANVDVYYDTHYHNRDDEHSNVHHLWKIQISEICISTSESSTLPSSFVLGHF